MDRAIKEYIIDQLKDLQAYRPSEDGLEHTVRCPYCGDSKDPTHSHLGVFIDASEDTAMLWHCFKCGMGGQVDDKFLEDIGVELSAETMEELKRYNKKLAKLHKRGIIRTERFIVPLCQSTPLNDEKLRYVNARLGTRMSFSDAQANKIIPSAMAFLAANELKHFEGVQAWLIKILERDYVGFLSSNNNLLTFRNIRQNSKSWRYYKVLVNPLNQDNATFYSIPSKLDLLYTGPLNVYVAEGTFDILSIKYNVRPSGSENQIFYAACGYSYMGILKHLARNGILTDINLHVFADADKSDEDHIEMVENSPISEFIEHFYIHRNAFPHEKDYGVPESNIIDKCRQVW